MKNDTSRLWRLVPPPAQPVTPGSPELFAGVERAFDLVLPADYKEIIATYGDGQWQEFWYLLNPFSANPHLNLIAQAPREDVSGNDQLSAERYIKERHPEYPHPIWPERGGIFPWGATDNGGRFFWLTEGVADEWRTIYYPSRDPDSQTFELSVSEILCCVLLGELPLFAEEFGDESPAPLFTPLR
jgi:hypothetical protein